MSSAALKVCSQAFLVGLLLGGCAARRSPTTEAALPEQELDLPDVPPSTVLVESAGHLDPTPRALAMHWLIALDQPPGTKEWGTRAVYDPSAWVQRSGVEALAAKLPDPAAKALLEEFVQLGQADPYMRSIAGIRLAPHGSEAAAAALAAAWRAESEPWLIAPLALGAAALGDTDGLSATADALATGEVGLELDFLREVGLSGHPELQQALATGAGSVEEEMILPFASAQVQLGDPSGEQALRRALQHSSAEVRLGVLDLLADLDHPTSTALLQRAKSDSTHLVRAYARLALAERSAGDPELFAKAAVDPDREVRELAVRFVARAAQRATGNAQRKLKKEADRIVAAALHDEEGTVRLEAVRAALLLDARTLAPQVAALTRDPWVHLRIEAAGAALALGYVHP